MALFYSILHYAATFERAVWHEWTRGRDGTRAYRQNQLFTMLGWSIPKCEADMTLQL